MENKLTAFSAMEKVFKSYDIDRWINEYCLDKDYQDFLNEITEILNGKESEVKTKGGISHVKW